jgi:murein DD-endopeptidase MepM/ murein hydrolase activator NlpD
MNGNIRIILFIVFAIPACSSICDDIMIPDQQTTPYVLPFPVNASHGLFQGYCFGWGHRQRLAYDFYLPFGDTITAARPGIVCEVHNKYADNDHQPGHNNRVVIRHRDGTMAWYAHLQKGSATVSVGDSVTWGSIIGLCGTSGRSGKVPHLHFEVFKSRKYDNNDAMPVSFYNIDGPLNARGGLIEEMTYTAVAYNEDSLIANDAAR